MGGGVVILNDYNVALMTITIINQVSQSRPKLKIYQNSIPENNITVIIYERENKYVHYSFLQYLFPLSKMQL